MARRVVGDTLIVELKKLVEVEEVMPYDNRTMVAAMTIVVTVSLLLLLRSCGGHPVRNN
jgi:hypothetical protein